VTRRAWQEAFLDSRVKPHVGCELQSDDIVSIFNAARTESMNGGREICGILFGRPSGHLDLKPLTNIIERPGAWGIDSDELRRAKTEIKSQKCTPLGTYHSHVRGFPYPSKGDMRSARPGELMLIMDVNACSLGLWKNPSTGQLDGWTSIPIWCSAIRVGPELATVHSMHLEALYRQTTLRAKTWIPWWDHDEFSRGIRVMNRYGRLL
jgi:proteasome lid subunit RPN8/RPN11